MGAGFCFLELRGFKSKHFKNFHPGGNLGKDLKYVSELMHKGSSLPLAKFNEKMSKVIVSMTQKSFGCIGVVNKQNKIIGIITDGDLRRSLLMSDDFTKIEIKDILNKSPMTAYENDNLQVAHERMKEARLQSLVVKNNDEKIVGVIQLFK